MKGNIMNHQLILATALAGLVASGISSTSFAADPNKEKCYGIAKAGQNDCANLSGTHSCAGQSKTNNDVGEWKLVAKGTCKSLNGLVDAEAKAKFKSTKS
jgi:uncharacterized membrane protein